MKYETFKFFRKIFGNFAKAHEERILEKANDIRYYRTMLEEEEQDLCERIHLENRERAQREGKLAVISFDMKNSRKGYDNDLLEKLFNEYYSEIKKCEETWGRKFLHEPAEKMVTQRNGYFRLGDQFCFPIEYEEVVEQEFFTYIFEKVKKKLNVTYQFHFILLRYESDFYADRFEKYTLMEAYKDSEELAKEKEETI